MKEPNTAEEYLHWIKFSIPIRSDISALSMNGLIRILQIHMPTSDGTSHG